MRLQEQLDRIIEQIEAGETVDAVKETVLAGFNFVADELELQNVADEQLRGI